MTVSCKRCPQEFLSLLPRKPLQKSENSINALFTGIEARKVERMLPAVSLLGEDFVPASNMQFFMLHAPEEYVLCPHMGTE